MYKWKWVLLFLNNLLKFLNKFSKSIGNDISQKRINVSQRKKIRKNTPKNVSPQNRVSALPQTQHVSRLISPPQKPAIAIDMKVLHRNFLKKIAHIPDADRTT